MNDIRPAHLTSEQTSAIVDAVKGIDLSTTDAWGDLDILSTSTQIEAIEVFEDEIRGTDRYFEGPVNVHVTLEYSDDVTLSETFPGRFSGRFVDGQIRIESLHVDTSSFTN